MDYSKKILSSPQTTIAGILTFLAVASTQLFYSFDADPVTTTNWNIVINAAGILWIGLFARDNATSSEEAGVK